MSISEVKPGTLFERDGKKREFVRVIPANRYTSAAVEWRRPGQECRSSACSLDAWTKWAKGALQIEHEQRHAGNGS
ncbi:hypothetical protein [Acidovorax delafieldii]|uniref:hypothetical protein n=1 Tax=Acidovorax delafieldii TaxID=47920 RepID=UPI003ECDCF0B